MKQRAQAQKEKLRIFLPPPPRFVSHSLALCHSGYHDVAAAVVIVFVVVSGIFKQNERFHRAHLLLYSCVQYFQHLFHFGCAVCTALLRYVSTPSFSTAPDGLFLFVSSSFTVIFSLQTLSLISFIRSSLLHSSRGLFTLIFFSNFFFLI